MTLADEVYLLSPDEEPCTIQIEAGFSGQIDDGRLHTAVAEAFQRHPATRLRLYSRRRFLGRSRWIVEREQSIDAGDVLDVVSCENDADRDTTRNEFFSDPISLTQPPLVRVRLVHHPSGDSVMLGANHAAFDGVGGLRLLRSIARAYVGDPDPLPQIDPIQARDPKSFGNRPRGRNHRIARRMRRTTFRHPVLSGGRRRE